MRVLDLFSGCGGLSLGLAAAGYDVVAAIEKDRWAAETYSYNHPSVDLLTEDIRSFRDAELRRRFRRKVDMVVGGPPCQGFSVSGHRQFGVYKEENRLVAEFVRVVAAVRPDHFLLENVRGFTSATIEGRTRALDFILEELRLLGYNIHHEVLDAREHGVPQLRKRLFVVGMRGDIGYPFPAPTHAVNGARRLRRAVTTLEAIRDLPLVNAREGRDDFQPYTHGVRSTFARRMREGAQGVFNHEAMKHTERLVARFAKIPPGGSAHRSLNGGSSSSSRVPRYKSNNQRLDGDVPALCITANWQSSYIHPTLHRNLTVREAARLQTFPDRFVFKGRRAVMSHSLLRSEGRDGEAYLSQSHQVGNAVPPVLAEEIGRAIRRAIDDPVAAGGQLCLKMT